MNPTTNFARRPNMVRDRHLTSDQATLAAILKECRKRIGYCSVFATIPALLTSHAPIAHSDVVRKPEPSRLEQGARGPQQQPRIDRNHALLKQQSSFRLPHQMATFNLVAALGGSDDCPGTAIPAGGYTSSTPFVDSGDTTGANDTVTTLETGGGFYYYYYYYSGMGAIGPDRIYSFTLTARGAQPEIRVSTSSGTYQPLIYILDGRSGCPAGTGNTVANHLASTNAVGNTAILTADQMNGLPLNVPLHLFVDSIYNDNRGSGPYTLQIQDVTIASAPAPTPTPTPTPVPTPPPGSQINPTDFVRQHYRDFLNREPDTDGLAFWTNDITSCGNDAQCLEVKSIHVSAAFFFSIEFQETGYLAYRMRKSAFGNLAGLPVPVTFAELGHDAAEIGNGVQVGIGNWQAQLEANKQAYALAFVQQPKFLNTYPNSLTASELVANLNQNAGNVLSTTERNELIALLGSNPADSTRRSAVLRVIAENDQFKRTEFNRAFVLMQYFGYLRRNPNDSPDTNFDGYNFWLTKLDSFGGDFIRAEMVKAFISSAEYRRRYGLS